MTTQQMTEALVKYVEWHGPLHDDGCPEDDTCECSLAWVNAGVNAAYNHLRTASKAPAFPRESPSVSGQQERIAELLRDLRRFIEYARYELEPTLVSGAQFPSQACADKRLAAIDEALSRLSSPPPSEPPIPVFVQGHGATWCPRCGVAAGSHGQTCAPLPPSEGAPEPTREERTAEAPERLSSEQIDITLEEFRRIAAEALPEFTFDETTTEVVRAAISLTDRLHGGLVAVARQKLAETQADAEKWHTYYDSANKARRAAEDALKEAQAEIAVRLHACGVYQSREAAAQAEVSRLSAERDELTERMIAEKERAIRAEAALSSSTEGIRSALEQKEIQIVETTVETESWPFNRRQQERAVLWRHVEEVLAALADPSPTAQPATCVWHLDDGDDAFWETSCGGSFQFIDDGPQENKFRFCYSCGKPIEVSRTSDDVVDEEEATPETKP